MLEYCPNPDCGYPLEPGTSFCFNCGFELSKAETADTTGKDEAPNRETGEPKQSEKAESFRGELSGRSGQSPDGGEGKEPSFLKKLVTEIKSAAPPPEPRERDKDEVKENFARRRRPGKSHCTDLDVSYNISQVFLEETCSPFEFRCVPRADGITDICIELEARGILRLLYHAPEEEFIRGEDYPAEIEFWPPKGKHGNVPFHIYIGYRKNNRDYWFVAHQTHRIFPRNAPAGKVLENLIININDNIEITQGHAGDINISRKKIEGLTRDLRGEKAKTLEDIKLPKVDILLPLRKGRPLPLHPVRIISIHRELTYPPREAILKQLTIKTSRNQLIHLISLPEIQLGKNRACDIVTRMMDESGRSGLSHNEKLSRFHCRLELHGGICRLIDLGVNKKKGTRRPSINGVYLNRSHIPPGESISLPLDRLLRITLAGADGTDPQVFGFEGKVLSCESTGRCRVELHGQCTPTEASCMILRRQDRIPETFVILWKFCPLSILKEEIPADWQDACLFRYRGAFAYRVTRNAAASWGWLIPGQSPTHFNEAIEVLPFKQFGL